MPGELVIFQHMPKTAGTTLRELVLANYAQEEVMLVYSGDGRGGTPPPRRPEEYRAWYRTVDPELRERLRFVASHSASCLTRFVERPYRVLSLLRDPVDRVGSLYSFVKRQAQRDRPAWKQELGNQILRRGWSVADIYLNLGGANPTSTPLHELFSEFFNGQARKVLRPWDQDYEMKHWAGQPDEAVVLKRRALELLARDYVVGVQEQFEQSVDLFCTTFGWKPSTIPPLNVGRPAPLDPETRELIAVYNEIDAELHAHFEAALDQRARGSSGAPPVAAAKTRGTPARIGSQEPDVVCVLGAHRSGTSLTTNIINLLGVELGPEADLMAAEPTQNPAGFWEHEGLVRLNEDLLASISLRSVRPGHAWREARIPPEGWECQASLGSLRDRARDLLSKSFGGKPRWGWKDPRTSLTLPFWQLLVPGLKHVISVRHPLDVVASLYARDGMLEREALEMWLRYTSAAVMHTRGRPRIVVPYERWFSSTRVQLERVARFLNLTEEASRAAVLSAVEREVDARLWHHRSDEEGAERLPRDVRALQAALEEAADGSDGPLDEIAAEIHLGMRSAATGERAAAGSG